MYECIASVAKKDISIFQGMDFDWCVQPDIGLPKPDAVIYLNRAIDVSSQSDSFGEERYEDLNFQKTVAEMFKKLESPDWKVSELMLF